MSGQILKGYAEAAPDLIAKFEAISSAALYKPIADLLPTQPSRILDLGAGTGRDAAWLAEKGHQVLAVEPVDELRHAGIGLHGSSKIEWISDRLPALQEVLKRGAVFDRVFLVAVWQHLDDDQRRIAMCSLSGVTVPGGVVVMSLRHGPGAPGRQVYDVSTNYTIEVASAAGFELLCARQADSVQAANRSAGVSWTWLAFERR